jgi:predicted TPR repeat methyltransferase
MCLESAFSIGDRVLDLGCGAGRFALRVGRDAGMYVGVDASAAMIEVARSKCPDLNFVVADLIDFVSKPSTWDVILLMGNVLDCLHPHGRRAEVLGRCADLLSEGGYFVGSSHLTKPSQPSGYYAEDYHGSEVQNFRSSLADVVTEVESFGFELALVMRDYRKSVPDWCYWVGKMRATADQDLRLRSRG